MRSKIVNKWILGGKSRNGAAPMGMTNYYARPRFIYSKYPVYGNIKVKIEESEVRMMENVYKQFPDMNKDSVIAKVWKRNLALKRVIDDEVNAKGIKLLCKKDCCSCCCHYFYISPAEYFAIKHYLLSTNPDVFYTAEQISEQQWEQLKAEFPHEYNKLTHPTDKFENDHEHLSMFEQCPFQQDGLCAVYEVRPLICQLYGTSYYVDPCWKHLRKLRSILSGNISEERRKKHYIDIDPKSDDLHEGIDYILQVFPDPDDTLRRSPIVHRAYPISYWLSMDSDYDVRYRLAITAHEKRYWNRP